VTVKFLPALRTKTLLGQVQGPMPPGLTPEGKTILSGYYNMLASAGIDVTDRRRRRWEVQQAVALGYQRVVWVFKSVDAISTNSARLPYRLKQGEDEVKDHPLYNLLNKRANPLETGRQFRERLSGQVQLSTRGAFVELTLSGSGDPVRADLLPPHRTRPVPGTGKELLKHYELMSPEGRLEREIDPAKVRWIRKPDLLDAFSGQTAMDPASLSIELDYFARLFNTSFMRNDGRPGGILGVEADTDELDMDRIESRFGKGPVEAGKLTVLGGKLTYVDTAQTPRDAQYVQASMNARNEIIAAFGVPLSQMGDASGKCVDDQTETLTQRGWVSGWDLTTKDTILAMDPADGVLKWSPVNEVYRNPAYDGDVYRLRHAHLDALVTPGHKWAVVPRPGQGKRLTGDEPAAVKVKVEDLSTHDRIMVMGKPEVSVAAPFFTDAFVELVGWAVTEGHYTPNEASLRRRPGRTAPYVQIRQNVGDNADRIERVAKEAGATFSVTRREDKIMVNVRGEIAAAIQAVSPDRVLTENFLLNLTPAQRELLLHTMLDADGHRQKTTASWTFGQKEQAAAEAFQFLATLCGYTTSIRRREYEYRHKGIAVVKHEWLVIVRQRRIATIQRNTRTVEHYRGMVWCPNTDYGTFVARRNGRVFVTSNTFANADAEAYMFWTQTMQSHNDLILTGFDEDSEDDLEGYFDTSSIEVLQRWERDRREEMRREVEAGLRSIYSYAEEAGITDVESTPVTRALWIPVGKMPVATTEGDEKALADFQSGGAPVEQPAPDQATQDAYAPDQAAPSAPDAAGTAPPDVGSPTNGSGAGTDFSQQFVFKGLRMQAKAADPAATSEADPKDLGRVEAAVDGALGALVTRQAEVVAARLRSPKVRRGTKHWTPTGPGDERYGTKALDAAKAVDAARWGREAEDAVRPIVTEATRAAAAAFIADLGLEGKARHQMPDDAVKAAGDAAAEALWVAKTAVVKHSERLAEIIAQADADGATVDQIVDRVKEHAEQFRRGWSRVVAVQVGQVVIEGTRVRVGNLPRYRRDLLKTWRHKRPLDDKVRPSHRKADGQQRRAGQPFDIGGASVRFPGDPLAPPEASINCRCHVRYSSRATGKFVSGERDRERGVRVPTTNPARA
jgi:HK97 family phage portal protein